MANPSYQHPLKEEHCACLDKVLQATANALSLARDCQECGLDTTGFIEELEKQKDVATRLKAKFFPNRM